MSTHNIGFYEDLTKIIFELSLNTHLISSAESVSQALQFNQMQSLNTDACGKQKIFFYFALA